MHIWNRIAVSVFWSSYVLKYWEWRDSEFAAFCYHYGIVGKLNLRLMVSDYTFQNFSRGYIFFSNLQCNLWTWLLNFQIAKTTLTYISAALHLDVLTSYAPHLTFIYFTLNQLYTIFITPVVFKHDWKAYISKANGLH